MTAMKGPTGIVQEEAVLIVVNTIQVAQKILVSVLKGRVATAVIINPLLLSAILKFRPSTVVLGVRIVGQMLPKGPEPDLNIVLEKMMNVPRNGLIGQTGPVGELLTVAGLAKFARSATLNVNIIQAV